MLWSESRFEVFGFTPMYMCNAKKMSSEFFMYVVPTMTHERRSDGVRMLCGLHC